MTAAVLASVGDLARGSRSAAAVVLDASWIYGPFNGAGIDVRRRYADAHIPGSWFLDLEALADPAGRPDPRVAALVPPAPHRLRAALARAGAVGPGTPLVVTDMDGGCTTAPFARYALRAAGFADIRLLDGGTPAWSAAGRPLTDSSPRYLGAEAPPQATTGAGDGDEPPGAAGVFAGFADFLAAARGSDSVLVLDARLPGGNAGVLPDDYRDVDLPAHVRLPSTDVLEPCGVGLRFRSAADLRARFAAAGLGPGRPVVAACYFGLGAAVVATALEIAGFAGISVFPGSLVEYAVRTGRVAAPAGH